MVPTRGVGLRSPTRCRNNEPVATATPEVVPRTPTSRPNLVSVGTIVWLSSELMFFAALFAMYFTIRSVDKGMGKPWPPVKLDLPLATTNTLVLLLSSVTCQLGVFAVERGQIRRTGHIWDMSRWGLREWYVLTFLMGLYFDCGQGYEYLFDLIKHQHLTLSSSNYGSVFYLTTGFHGLHVAGGLVAFLFLLGRTFAAKKFTNEQQVSAIVVSYYWHFVDVVWIGLFTTIYLIH
jgi:cytochrome c oxidase subunit III